jgi:hypothetical protein
MVNVSKSVIAAFLILLFVVGYIAYDKYSAVPATGQITSQDQNDYRPQAQPAVQTAQKPSDLMLSQQQACTQLSASKPSGEKASFMELCMQYMYRFCFSESDCGPYSCANNKCQVG